MNLGYFPIVLFLTFCLFKFLKLELPVISSFFPTGEFDSNSSNIITHVVFTDGEDQGECASEEMLSAEVIVEVRNVATYLSSYTLQAEGHSCKSSDLCCMACEEQTIFWLSTKCSLDCFFDY